MKIEKCPFCGDEAETKMYLWGEHAETHAPIWCYYAFCRACDAMTDNVFKTEEEAIAAWNRRAEPENKPLTLDELRQMDGEPVYVVTLDNPLENQPYWAIAGINSNDSRYQNGVALYNRVQDDWGAFDLYGDTWLAYRAKPERGEG